MKKEKKEFESIHLSRSLSLYSIEEWEGKTQKMWNTHVYIIKVKCNALNDISCRVSNKFSCSLNSVFMCQPETLTYHFLFTTFFLRLLNDYLFYDFFFVFSNCIVSKNTLAQMICFSIYLFIKVYDFMPNIGETEPNRPFLKRRDLGQTVHYLNPL